MKFKGLSERLKKAYELALPNEEFWDIGCDHGLLGFYAYKTNQFQKIHFVDPAEHMILKLKDKLQDGKNVFFWSCKVEDIECEIHGNFIFLGVGASTIQKSLSQLPELKARRLILGPHKDSLEIRDMKLVHYHLVGEFLVEERGRTRPLYVYDRITSTVV